MVTASSSFALDFLRRLLCAHTTHNATARHGDSGTAVAQPTPGGAEGRSPCVVARLMGLDAMPELRRSRSAEGWPAPAPREVVCASASVRERPAYLRQENDEFLLLSFSPEPCRDGNGEEESFLLASSTRGVAAGEGRRGGAAKKQSRGRRKLQYGVDEEEADSSCRRGRTTPAAECTGVQNSSPVSVLDAQEESSTATTTTSCSWEEAEEQAEHGLPTSEEIRHALKQQGSRRKLQPDFDDDDDDLDNLLLTEASTSNVFKCSGRERRNRRVVNKAEVITPDVTGSIWQFICRLVEEDMNRMRWVTTDGESIAADIGSEILDQLMCEATHELMQTSSETLHFFPWLLHLCEAPMFQNCSE